MKAIKSVELRTAYAFDCEECGTENFVRATVHEFSPEETEELRDEHGVEGVTGDFVTVPPILRCSNCGTEFKAAGSIDEE